MIPVINLTLLNDDVVNKSLNLHAMYCHVKPCFPSSSLSPSSPTFSLSSTFHLSHTLSFFSLLFPPLTALNSHNLKSSFTGLYLPTFNMLFTHTHKTILEQDSTRNQISITKQFHSSKSNLKNIKIQHNPTQTTHNQPKSKHLNHNIIVSCRSDHTTTITDSPNLPCSPPPHTETCACSTHNRHDSLCPNPLSLPRSTTTTILPLCDHHSNFVSWPSKF